MSDTIPKIACVSFEYRDVFCVIVLVITSSVIFMSAVNFSDADLPSPPVLDAVLEPGDLLYFPRGYIHQVSARCVLTHAALLTFSR